MSVAHATCRAKIVSRQQWSWDVTEVIGVSPGSSFSSHALPEACFSARCPNAQEKHQDIENRAPHSSVLLSRLRRYHQRSD